MYVRSDMSCLLIVILICNRNEEKDLGGPQKREENERNQRKPWENNFNLREELGGSQSHALTSNGEHVFLAQNGNLVNAAELREFLDHEAHRHINTDSDSELLLNIFANNLNKTGKSRINEEDIFTAIKGIFDVCHGGYACVAMIAGKFV